jgi:hypothetical protein
MKVDTSQSFFIFLELYERITSFSPLQLLLLLPRDGKNRCPLRIICRTPPLLDIGMKFLLISITVDFNAIFPVGIQVLLLSMLTLY